jgi:hypothetical protein
LCFLQLGFYLSTLFVQLCLQQCFQLCNVCLELFINTPRDVHNTTIFGRTITAILSYIAPLHQIPQATPEAGEEELEFIVLNRVDTAARDGGEIDHGEEETRQVARPQITGGEEGDD